MTIFAEETLKTNSGMPEICRFFGIKKKKCFISNPLNKTDILRVINVNNIKIQTKMNRLLVIVCCLMMSLTSLAQVKDYPYVSTSQTGGRFEIIQSPMSRRLTFKLDKYSGNVYQLVKNEDKKLAWKKLLNMELDLLNIFLSEKVEEKISFQLFMGGMFISDCFLLNIHNGMAYHLYEDSETGDLFFALMRDPSIENEKNENPEDEEKKVEEEKIVEDENE